MSTEFLNELIRERIWLKFDELLDELDVCEEMLTVSASFCGVAMAIGAVVLNEEALAGVVLAETVW